MVPRAHRRRALPDRRHVVADRDRRHHDHARCPGATTTKPGSATFPLPGIVGRGGRRRRQAGRRRAAATSRSPSPWPAMLRGIWGDPERYRETYWSRFAGRYFAGDGAKLDDDGYLWLLGRVDDVMNVSGHRISTTEVESALVDPPRGGRGRGRRRQRRHHRSGDHRLRDLRGGHERADRSRSSATTWPPRSARSPSPKTIYFTPDLPEDPQRQDHAPPAARRRRGPQPRRHHHARRRRRRRARSSAAPPRRRRRTEPRQMPRRDETRPDREA